jgi:C4-dicarboxylate transporter DctM subunit
MDPLIVGFLGIVLLLVLFIIGVPIGIAMGIAGFVGFAYVTNPMAALHIVSVDMFTFLNSYTFSALPMFIIMGSMAFAAGIGKKAFDTSYILMGRLNGGLIVATAVASAIFGMVCGSGPATNVAIGKTAIPEMEKHKYNQALALGAVACSGTLGFMIPPSAMFILYGILTEQSIGKLFVAGILPGILITVLFCATGLLLCWRRPEWGPAGESTTMKQKMKSLLGLADAGILFILVMGGLFGGYFTPTTAGAIGAAGAVIIGLVRREMTWPVLSENLKDSLRLICMIFMLIVGAMIFGHFITASGLAQALVDWVGKIGLSSLGIIIFVSSLFFIFGFFIDMAPLLLILLPLFYPLISQTGYDMIWFGVIIVLLCMIGIITPPVGTNIFVTKGLVGDKVPLSTVFKGCLIFLIPMTISLILLIAFPEISLVLGRFVYY